MAGKQQKLYRAGQKKSAGAGVVGKTTQQGVTSKKQTGKTHSVKNRTANHNRNGW